ncbi:hypothetical protein [Spirosoma areae]
MQTLSAPQHPVAGPRSAERHKPGTVLSRKERQGQAMDHQQDPPAPFFVPAELLQTLQKRQLVRHRNGQQGLIWQPTLSLFAQSQQSITDFDDSLIIRLPTDASESENEPTNERAEPKPVSAAPASLPSPAPPASAVSPVRTQPVNGAIHTAFSPDFRAIDIAPATPKTESGETPQLIAQAETLPELNGDANSALPAQAEAAPASSAEDPAFQTTIQGIKQTRRVLRDHPKPQEKVDEYTNAAVLPEETQRKGQDRSQHFATIGEKADQTSQKREAFKPETFKELLGKQLAEIEKKLPRSESEADAFKRDKPLEGVKQSIGQEVKEVSETQTGQFSQEVKKPEPPPANLPVQTPQLLKANPPGKKPGGINPAAATPKPKADAQISLEPESRSVDDLMAANQLTDEQLANSNEPRFLEALSTKQQAQQAAAQAPQTYRQAEQQTLASAQKKAAGTANAKVEGMFSAREQTFSGVYDQQGTQKDANVLKQEQVTKEFESIYNLTKSDVNTILTDLSAYVNDTFATEADAAKATFEKNVESELSDIYGFTTWDDTLFGEDTEAIDRAFRQEKATFLRALDATLSKIAERIAYDLNRAILRIDKGREDKKKAFDSLNDEQKRLLSETSTAFDEKFNNLESSVDDKQTELAESLAESYHENVTSLNESFQKIKEEVSTGWLEKAAEFIKEVATAIYKLGELLISVLVRLANLIGDILAHPIRFLENIGRGIMLGFDQFMARLDDYLLAGFFDWLRGSVGKGGIQLPSSFTDAKGLFNLAAQLVDVSVDTFWGIAEKRLGKPFMDALKKGEEWAREGFELFQIVQKEGIGGLWEHVKATIADGVSELFAKVKETVLYEVVRKTLAFVASLFTPAGAFIKAIQLLYRGIRFLVDNIDRIVQLVDAFLDSVELAVKGDVSGIASKVVLALRNVIVIAIDFLAKLLGLGNLGEKIHRIVQTIRRPIIRAMEWVVDKAKPLVKRIMKGAKGLAAKGKKVVGGAIDKVKGWLGIKKEFTAENGEHHELYFKGKEANAQLTLASNKPVQYIIWVSSIEIETDTKAGQKRAGLKKSAIAKAQEIDALKAKKVSGSFTDEEKSDQLQGLLTELSILTGPLFAGHRLDWAEPVFGGLYKGLYGVSMNAGQVSKNKMPKGSAPAINNESYATINQRRNQGGSYYVLGHLLSNKLGGTGRDAKNLTPLTRSANAQHEINVEKLVKAVINEGNLVKYTVVPRYDRPSAIRSLENAVDRSDIEEDPETVKAIMREEVNVPTELDCQATMVNPQNNAEVPLVADKIKNTIDQSPEAYDLVGKKREIICLQSDDVSKIVKIGHGLSQQLAIKIKQAFFEKNESDGTRFSSYDDLRYFNWNGKDYFSKKEKDVIESFKNDAFVILYKN